MKAKNFGVAILAGKSFAGKGHCEIPDERRWIEC